MNIYLVITLGCILGGIALYFGDRPYCRMCHDEGNLKRISRFIYDRDGSMCHRHFANLSGSLQFFKYGLSAVSIIVDDDDASLKIPAGWIMVKRRPSYAPVIVITKTSTPYGFEIKQ